MGDQDTAQDYAAQLHARSREILETDGHACAALGKAWWNAAMNAAVCGCGVFVEVPEPDSTPMATELEIPGYDPLDPLAHRTPLVDPQTVTPAEIEYAILTVLSRLENGAHFERQCSNAAAEAAHAYQCAWDKALLLSTERSEARRKAAAGVACEDAGLGQKKLNATVLHNGVKATMHTLRAQLSGFQSVSRTVAATYNAGGSAGRPY